MNEDRRQGAVPCTRPVLVVVFNDYGELGNALNFLGAIPDCPAVLLLPRSLEGALGAEQGLDVRSYADLGELVRIAEAVRPEVALLFSGYFLTLGERPSARAAFRTLRALENMGCTIVTSDPFVGLLRGPASLDFRSLLIHSRRPVARLKQWLQACRMSFRLALVAHRLRDAWKLYPAPPPSGAGDQCLGYYSPAPPAATGSPGNGRTWVFVLSQVDHDAQVRAHGTAFYEHLAARLADATRLGARPVLVGPPSLVREMDGRALAARAHVFGNLAFRDFVRQIRHAERVFYWNFFSFSILHRVIAGRPALFFDAGHMVRILPALATVGIRTFYRGWRPPLLPLEVPLDEHRLDAVAAETLEAFDAIRRHLATGLPPEAVLERVRAAGSRRFTE